MSSHVSNSYKHHHESWHNLIHDCFESNRDRHHNSIRFTLESTTHCIWREQFRRTFEYNCFPCSVQVLVHRQRSQLWADHYRIQQYHRTSPATSCWTLSRWRYRKHYSCGSSGEHDFTSFSILRDVHASLELSGAFYNTAWRSNFSKCCHWKGNLQLSRANRDESDQLSLATLFPKN